MRAVLIPAAIAAALAAAPAFAAQPGNQAADQPAQAAGGQQGQSGQAQNGAQQQWQAMSQAQLRGSLEKAGYKNIRIVDAAYVVEAQGPSGEQVVMYINPPDVPKTASNAGNDMTAGQGAGQSTTGHAAPGKGSGGQ